MKISLQKRLEKDELRAFDFDSTAFKLTPNKKNKSHFIIWSKP
jgi:hypothetical protein